MQINITLTKAEEEELIRVAAVHGLTHEHPRRKQTGAERRLAINQGARHVLGEHFANTVYKS